MTCLILFLTFFKIGAFTFGGGYAMLPLIQEEVLAHGWLTSEDLVNFIAVSESTPGPFAVNISTYIGSVTAGIPGAFFATLGVVLPSFLIILIIARFFAHFQSSRPVTGVMKGLRPAVVGLIGAAVISVGQTVFVSAENAAGSLLTPQAAVSAAIFALMIFLSVKKVHPILIIVLSAVLGICSGILLR